MTTILCLSLTIATVVAGSVASAQQPKKIPRIAYLSGGNSTSANSALNAISQREAFQQGLRQLGYAEGKNIVIEWRYAEGKLDRLAALAAELVSLNVDIIVTGGQGATRPAHEATNTIPIVMTQDPDPVRNGFAANLARPGGNITGLSTLAPELSGKQVELLKEIIPKLSRVAVFGNSTNPANAESLRETEIAAGLLAVKLQYKDVRDQKDIKTAFRAAGKEGANAILAVGTPLLNAHRTEVVDLAIKSRLPAIYWRSDFVENGGLMSYGVSFTDLNRRAATYVDKILKGSKPGDLPVEQPKKFELVINLKTAKQIGLTIPPNVLARADRVIR
jgi:putative ABC transport system substrate-binding protein